MSEEELTSVLDDRIAEMKGIDKIERARRRARDLPDGGPTFCGVPLSEFSFDELTRIFNFGLENNHLNVSYTKRAIDI